MGDHQREKLDLLFKMENIKAQFMPYMAPGVSMKIVTDLGGKDQNGNKKRFYEETIYKSSKYRNVDELVTANFRVNSYLALEYPNPQYREGSNLMRSKVLFIRAYAMDDVVAKMREFNDEYARCYGMKDGKLYVFADRAKSVTVYPSATSSLTFSTDVYENKSANTQEMGVRLVINEEFSTVISAETTWPELLYRMSKCDLTMLSLQMIQSYMAILPGMAVSRFGENDYSSTSRYAPYWEAPDDIANRPESVQVNRTKPTTKDGIKKSFFSDL